jgi:hypothetical protein
MQNIEMELFAVHEYAVARMSKLSTIRRWRWLMWRVTGGRIDFRGGDRDHFSNYDWYATTFIFHE